MNKTQLEDSIQKNLILDPQTGLAAYKDTVTGTRHTVHPNIAASGSVKGMKKLYWGQKAIVVYWAGFYYNISLLSISDPIDAAVAQHCQCFSCRHRT